MHESYEKRQKDNALLKSNGYRWKQQPDQSWLLFDPRGQIVEKPKALQDIADDNVPKPEPVFSLMDRPAAIRWAQAIVGQPQTGRRVVVLDTETSGLDETSMVIEVSIVDLAGNTIYDSLVCPGDDVVISAKASEVHGIDRDMVYWAEKFEDVWKELCPILESSEIVIYNAAYDVRLLRQTAEKNGLEMPALTTHCLMHQFSMYYGELIGPDKEGCYKNKKQDIACREFGVTLGTHRALDDAKAALNVLRAMAHAKIFE